MDPFLEDFFYFFRYEEEKVFISIMWRFSEEKSLEYLNVSYVSLSWNDYYVGKNNLFSWLNTGYSINKYNRKVRTHKFILFHQS